MKKNMPILSVAFGLIVIALLLIVMAKEVYAHHGTEGMSQKIVISYPNGQPYMIKETFMNSDRKTKNQAIVMEYDMTGNVRIVTHVAYKNNKETKRMVTRYNHLGHRISK